MKVVLVNGSPHKEGCTHTALCEIEAALNTAHIETSRFWIGNKPLSGCIACKTCVKKGVCVFDDTVNAFLGIAKGYDGYIFGTPVHGVQPAAASLLFLTVFFTQTSAVAATAFC